jgi:tetratricopeptide (TPR) repeat protein
VANFAVNLESQHEPFEPSAIEQAAQRLKTPAFVSKVDVDGETWYRLRVGPIERRSQAERVLRAAAKDYPRAWLAVGDDQRTSDPMAANEVGLPAVEPIGADPALSAVERKAQLSQARRAMSDHDYAQAILLLTRLQRQPEFAERAQVQELLGLSRERAGQLAHAKAEYEEYLRRYPEGSAAARVRMRLRILRASAMNGKQGGSDFENEHGWKVSGGASQLYRRDTSEIDTTNATVRSVNQNAVFNDGDVFARRKGERFDFSARVNGGYAKDLLPDGPGDRTRVSAAYFEASDQILGLSGRVGRQSRNSDGVLGTFDGLSASYQFRPSWTLGSAVGLPLESSTDGFTTNRQFATLSLGYAPEYSPWELSTFVATQRYDGFRDRQAVGFETGYFAANRSLSALIDYDTAFSSLNAAVLVGTLLLPARWTLSFDLERRNAPVLTTRNALIGQPVTSLSDLLGTFSEQDILQLAQDRTPVLSSYSLSTSKPIGERFQISADVIGSQIGATPASGGITAQPSTGLDLTYQLQFFGNSLLRAGDLNVLALRYDSTSTGKLASIGLMSRLPFFGAWRVSPRLRVDERRLTIDTGTRRLYVPTLRIDYQRARRLFELEMGAEIGQSGLGTQSNDSLRYFLGLGYRVGF